METKKNEITDEEVFQVVEKKVGNNDFKIVEYSTNMLGEWIGNCGDHAILKVKITRTNQKEKELNFFVKLYPRVESIIEFIEWTGGFKKEIFVYKIFGLIRKEEIKMLEDCVSECYLSVQKKFLIMDNLTAEGYTTMDRSEVFDYDTIKVVLEALSRLHASTIIFEEKTQIRLIENYEQDLEETYYSNRPDFANKDGLEAAITGILNMIELFDFPEKLLSGKNFKTILQEVCTKVYTLARPSKSSRNVITHGDIWATNVLIKKIDNKPMKAKLVDFQCGRYTPPAQDVLSVIYLTTSRDFRLRHMYNLIGLYYTNLEKNINFAGYDMNKILPFDEFLKSCEEQKVFGLIQAATYFPLILLGVEEAKDFFGDKEKNKEALFVDRSVLVKDYMEKNEDYKKRIKDCMQDLKDYCDYL